MNRWILLIATLLTGCTNTLTTVRAQEPLPAGVNYVWWDYGVDELEEISVDFEIHSDHGTNPGMYFQFYQGHIGSTGFYFGLQTNVSDPERGGRGKGILFSRWGTRDSANLRAVPGGWTQSAGYEGDFVGIRASYEWGARRYRFRLMPVDRDGAGVWYGLFLIDLDASKEFYAGSIRFGYDGGRIPRIKNGGGSWTEIYSGLRTVQDVPNTHISLGIAQANYGTLQARHATSDYSEYRNSNVWYDAATRRIHMQYGPSIVRRNAKGRLF